LRRTCTSCPQGDGDLGERLRAAFERAFAVGAKRVLIIGSDCPSVAAHDIHEAWKNLRTHDIVLGPASDGGYWLIGLRQLQPALLQNIPWSTENVFPETMKRVQKCGLSVRLLREREDVDTEAEWRRFLAARN